MHAPCLPPCTLIALHRPWWQRAIDALVERLRRPVPPRRRPEARDPASWSAEEWAALRELPARTLRDIGAPEWVHAGRGAAERIGLDLLRL